MMTLRPEIARRATSRWHTCSATRPTSRDHTRRTSPSPRLRLRRPSAAAVAAAAAGSGPRRCRRRTRPSRRRCTDSRRSVSASCGPLLQTVHGGVVGVCWASPPARRYRRRHHLGRDVAAAVVELPQGHLLLLQLLLSLLLEPLRRQRRATLPAPCTSQRATKYVSKQCHAALLILSHDDSCLFPFP